MTISFNGATRTITLGAGRTVLGVRELWSRWVDWWLTGDNSKYLLAFSQIGGNDIDQAAGTRIPVYLYLLNGWRIRPQEANHTLNVIDGVLLVDGGGDPFLQTLGSYVVRVNYQQPVQAISFTIGDGGGASPSAIAAAVLAALEAARIPVNVKEVNDTDVVGDGSEGDPWRASGVQP